jgi:hypothetical protein
MSESFDRALRAAARRGRGGEACPDPSSMAAYVDGSLLPDERVRFEAHVADCAACLEHLALLGTVSVDRGDPPEPSRSWFVRWGWLVPVATAVLVVAVWTRLPEPSAPPAVVGERTAPTAGMGRAGPEDAPVGSEQGFADAVPESPTVEQKRNLRDTLTRAEPSRQKASRDRDKPAPAAPPLAANAPETVPAEPLAAPRVPPPAAAPAPVPSQPQQAADAAAQTAERADTRARSARTAPDARPQVLEEEVASMQSARVAGELGKAAAAGLPATVISASPAESFRVVAGRIERSTDAGRSWQAVSEGAGFRAVAAACAPGGACWFGDDRGRLLRRTADGFFQAAPPAAARIVAIAPDGALAAVVTVEGGRRYRTDDGGATWMPAP